MAQTLKTISQPAKLRMLITGEQASVIMQLVRHVAIGGVGKVINIAGFWLLEDCLSVYWLISNVIVHSIAIIATFLLQKYVNYRDRDAINTRKQLIKFLINSFLYFCLDSFFIFLLLDVFKIPAFIAKVISSVVLVAASFLSLKFWVFRKKDT